MTKFNKSKLTIIIVDSQENLEYAIHQLVPHMIIPVESYQACKANLELLQKQGVVVDLVITNILIKETEGFLQKPNYEHALSVSMISISQNIPVVIVSTPDDCDSTKERALSAMKKAYAKKNLFSYYTSDGFLLDDSGNEKTIKRWDVVLDRIQSDSQLPILFH